MSMWKHLFADGEYPDRQRILVGLAPEHISSRPPGATHSIYQEVWHITRWQAIVLSRDPNRRDAWIRGGRYPSSPGPSHVSEYEDLVAEFLRGLEIVQGLTRSEDSLNAHVTDGFTFRDELTCLAVHNAYHLGKVVALRQQLGCWP